MTLAKSATIAQLKKRYGTDQEVPAFPLVEWRQAVMYDETRLGYWEWVAWKIEHGGPRGLTEHTYVD